MSTPSTTGTLRIKVRTDSSGQPVLTLKAITANGARAKDPQVATKLEDLRSSVSAWWSKTYRSSKNFNAMTNEEIIADAKGAVSTFTNSEAKKRELEAGCWSFVGRH
ncbi:hypothetical protein P7C73_g5243, partial [Tremellales sp. Uapishka_1]